ncbi:FISUMP domain-containing protein [Fibrobacter sp. UWB11]|uniref:FISUMP domain-containing protein n=1 Tax=Fibrobacter sp. UWB11 TaxID=1896202 RepID=UPI00092ACED1|nr:FISUMP domain-containing protein [Fibrobacter sp. UWB11]SIN92129.1 major paralogous domain-containing protein [Fibrobacter sp. UWB11]
MLDEVRRVLCAVAFLTVSVVTQNYATEFKDYRDGRVYRAIPSGNLNWFKQSLRYNKTSFYTDENGIPFYRDDSWVASCPEGTQVPDEMDWDQLIEDQFSGDDKLENMKNFVGHSSLGFYKFEMDEVVNVKKGFAYFAVRNQGNRAIRLETKRGTVKIVDLENSDAVQVRCVYPRDFLSEMGISKRDMIFTDRRDNKKYVVGVRGGKIWMMKNLAFSVTSEKQCYVEDKSFCEKFGRYYTYEDALKACPSGWHLPDDAEWRDFQKDRKTLDWDNLGQGGCQDWDNYCDGMNSGHYWSRTSIQENTARSWEFNRADHDIDRTDASVHKGLYVRCVADI